MQGAIQLGKLQGWTLAATNALVAYFSSNIYTHIRFLVNTGSEVSIVPPSSTTRKHPPDKLTLAAVNDTPIRTYGKKSLTLNLGFRRALPWIFIVADVQQPILGADFLRHFGVLIDMKQCQLRDTLTHFNSSPRNPVLVPPSSPKMLITNISLFFRNFLHSSRCLHQRHLSNTTLTTTLKLPVTRLQHVQDALHQSDFEQLS